MEEGKRKPGRPPLPDSERKTLKRVSRFGAEYYVALSRVRKTERTSNPERIQVRLGSGLYARLRRIAGSRGITVAELIRRTMEEKTKT